VRGFEVIQRDLVRLFDHIEPADVNLSTYSFRTFELLMRTCIEVEANLAAILRANEYKAEKLYMRDYRLVEASHRLSEYRVGLPRWTGGLAIRQPFACWGMPGQSHGPPWFDAYNKSKHDRAGKFDGASFNAVLDAMAGLVAVLSAQFLAEEFTGLPDLMAVNRGVPVAAGMVPAIGGVFQVSYPSNWPMEERYDFNHTELIQEDDPFVVFPYASPR
jgi:hypothetical protein